MASSALTTPQTPSAFRFGRLTQLWVLAVLVVAYSVLEMAIANSLFLTKVGAGHLPQVFILIGLGSLPSYLLFSQVVDRYSRPKLFQVAIALAIAIALGLRGLIYLDYSWVYYLLMVALFFQWDFHNTILYPSLLPDYFTATEYKQHTPLIGIGQAVGMLVGGLLTRTLPYFLRTPDLLYVVPILMGAAIALLWWLEQSQVKLITSKHSEHVGIIEAIKTFPKLARSYPLMLFLAASSFLLVIIYLTSEFLWFSVYEQYFTSDELTQFLGLMRILMSILQIVVLYCFTRPLLKWLGVSRMNVVFPITTLVSLTCFLFQINLWTGIGLHLNGDGLFKSINIPVHQLNYNAIPEAFIGRIRTLSDGVFYAVGLTLVGILLLLAHTYLTLPQITWIALGLGGLFFLLRVPMGRFYGAGLEEMIRANSIDLNDLPQGGLLPKDKSIKLIRDWFQFPSLDHHDRALDLAIELNCGAELLDDLIGLPTHNDNRLRQKILALLSQSQDPTLNSKLQPLLHSDLTVHRAIALEALIARHYSFSSEELTPLLESEVSEIRTLAGIALQPSECDLIPPFSDAAGQALLRVTAYSASPQQVTLILNGLGQSTQFAIAGLKTLTNLNQDPHPEAWEIVFPFLKHPDAAVRTAAYSYLGQHFPDKALEVYPTGFDDDDPDVRSRIAALVAQTPKGQSLALQQLKHSDPVRQTTAIAVLAKFPTKIAQDSLFAYLAPEFQLLKQTRQWERLMGPDLWQPIQVSIQDFRARLIQKVFSVLAEMGYESTVTAINYALEHSGGRDRANAIEVLSSFKERRFIRPLLPILETNRSSGLQSAPVPEVISLTQTNSKILEEAANAVDDWVKRGALATLAKLPEADLEKLAPSLKQQWTENRLAQTSMDQILLLKKVPIFQNLTLDELDLIRLEMEQFAVLAKQVIYEEGSWGQYFYVIESGTVELTKLVGDRPQKLKQIGVGDYFGEICLFDDAPRWDGAIAATDATLLKLEKDKFKALVMQRPRICLELCRFLSQRLREYDNFCDIRNQNV